MRIEIGDHPLQDALSSTLPPIETHSPGGALNQPARHEVGATHGLRRWLHARAYIFLLSRPKPRPDCPACASLRQAKCVVATKAIPFGGV
jgi:hypothetical protein